jgi:hypothetical protein
MSSPPWWLDLNPRRGAALYARTAFPALADGERLVDADAELEECLLKVFAPN